MKSSTLVRAVVPAAALFGLIAAAHAQSVTFTDPTGRQITLDAPAHRIVSFPVPMTSTIIALDGSPDRIAAMHPEAKLAIDFGLLGEFFPEAKSIPADILAGGVLRGTTPDPDKLKALNTDLVVQWAHAGDDGIKPLDDAGITHAIVRFGTDQDYQDALTMLGQAIGKPDRVDMLLKWRADVSAEIADGLKGLPDDQKQKVIDFFYGLTQLQAEAGDSYEDWEFQHVGGINAAAAGGMKGWGKVTADQVGQWNPDVILLGTFEPELALERIYHDPVLSQTNAAKNKRVYKLPLGGYRWGPASHESPLAWMWLADILYPDRFHFDVRAAIKEWYPKLYGHTPTDEQIDKILHMEMNSASANYEQFAAK